MQSTIEKIKELLQVSTEDKKSLLEDLEQLVKEEKYTSVYNTPLQDLSSIYNEIIIDKNPVSQKINTEIKILDEIYDGIQLGELVILGGRPSTGKTSLLCNLALNISSKHPVLFFSYDLDEQHLVSRMISILSGVDLSKTVIDELKTDQKKKLNTTAKEFKKHKLFISRAFNDSMSHLAEYIRKKTQELEIKVVIIDYIQLMSCRRFNSRDNEISYFVRTLKHLASELNISIVIASQLSRNVEFRGDKRPVLSDLRDSGSLEQDSDKVWLLYRLEEQNVIFHHPLNSSKIDTNLLELTVAKNRRGKTGIVQLTFNENLKISDYVRVFEEIPIVKERLKKIKEREKKDDGESF